MQITNNFAFLRIIRDCFPRYITMLAFLCATNAEGGDEQFLAKAAHLDSHVNVRTVTDDDGVKRIVAVGIKLTPSANVKKAELLALMPQLRELEHLKTLGIGGIEADDDLKPLPPLPQLRKLTLSQEPISDEALQYLDGMTGLEELFLSQTNIHGAGLRHLKEMSELEWLDLHHSPVDDRAIPHINSNFPKLRRANFDGTKITPDGLMQLANLHWLMTIAIPEEIVGPDPSAGSTREERRALSRERHQNKLELLLQYKKKYYLSRSAARGAGLEVPAENQYPFGYSEEMEDFIRQQRGAP